jgi:hypothetical protein
LFWVLIFSWLTKSGPIPLGFTFHLTTADLLFLHAKPCLCFLFFSFSSFFFVLRWSWSCAPISYCCGDGNTNIALSARRRISAELRLGTDLFSPVSDFYRCSVVGLCTQAVRRLSFSIPGVPSCSSAHFAKVHCKSCAWVSVSCRCAGRWPFCSRAVHTEELPSRFVLRFYEPLNLWFSGLRAPYCFRLWFQLW